MSLPHRTVRRSTHATSRTSRIYNVSGGALLGPTFRRNSINDCSTESNPTNDNRRGTTNNYKQTWPLTRNGSRLQLLHLSRHRLLEYYSSSFKKDPLHGREKCISYERTPHDKRYDIYKKSGFLKMLILGPTFKFENQF